jgi:hypothetical protein
MKTTVGELSKGMLRANEMSVAEIESVMHEIAKGGDTFPPLTAEGILYYFDPADHAALHETADRILCEVNGIAR